jgi:hypothetical protein
MGDAEVPLVITCDADEAEQLVEALRGTGLEVYASERRNLDGAAASEWVIAAAATMQAVAPILRALMPFFDRRRVRVFKFGDLVMQDVQPEDAAMLIAKLRGTGTGYTGDDADERHG